MLTFSIHSEYKERKNSIVLTCSSAFSESRCENGVIASFTRRNPLFSFFDGKLSKTPKYWMSFGFHPSNINENLSGKIFAVFSTFDKRLHVFDECVLKNWIVFDMLVYFLIGNIWKRLHETTCIYSSLLGHSLRKIFWWAGLQQRDFPFVGTKEFTFVANDFSYFELFK